MHPASLSAGLLKLSYAHRKQNSARGTLGATKESYDSAARPQSRRLCVFVYCVARLHRERNDMDLKLHPQPRPDGGGLEGHEIIGGS